MTYPLLLVEKAEPGVQTKEGFRIVPDGLRTMTLYHVSVSTWATGTTSWPWVKILSSGPDVPSRRAENERAAPELIPDATQRTPRKKRNTADKCMAFFTKLYESSTICVKTWGGLQVLCHRANRRTESCGHVP